MLTIRLKRVGRKGDASFRMIVTESHRSGQSNRYIDSIGFYNPRNNQKDVDVEKAKAWIAKGVQMSDTAHNILVDAGVVEGRKRNALPKKTAPIKEAPVAEAEPSPSDPQESAASTEETSASEDTSSETSAAE